MTPLKRKIVFVSEYAPLKNKGSGISVLLYSILLALKPFDLGLITFCGDTKIDPKEILSDNKGLKILIPDYFFYNLYRLKGAGLIKDFLIGVSFILNLPGIGKIINNNDTLVITMVGASGKPLWKFLLLKILFRKAKHGLYIVDDLALINKRNKNRIESFLIKYLLPLSIKKSDVLTTISNGLRDTYLKQFDKDSFILLPHFLQRDKLEYKPINDTFIFLFTGGLNFLYNNSLLKFAGVLNNMNKNKITPCQLKLKIQTYSSRQEFIDLGFENQDIIYSTINNREELVSVYSNCHSFIIPYSFKAEDEPIVKTSFPQKVAEIIQYAKPILVFGPQYSSVAQFFNTNRLDYVCSDPNDLKNTIMAVVENNNNFDSSNYINSYHRNLSADAIINVFDDIYNSINHEN